MSETLNELEKLKQAALYLEMKSDNHELDRVDKAQLESINRRINKLEKELYE